MNIKKIQSDLIKLNTERDFILRNSKIEQDKYYESMRKLNIKLSIYNNIIIKLQDQLDNIKQCEKEEKYQPEQIECAKNLLIECGYSIVKI